MLAQLVAVALALWILARKLASANRREAPASRRANPQLGEASALPGLRPRTKRRLCVRCGHVRTCGSHALYAAAVSDVQGFAACCFQPRCSTARPADTEHLP
jgi:hypothetical protein